MKAPIITTKRLILKPLTIEHLSQDYVNYNDIEVYKYLETGGNFTIEMLQEYLKEVEKKIFIFGQSIKKKAIYIWEISK